MSDRGDRVVKYAVGVIGQNIVIDCGTHDEAMRLAAGVRVTGEPSSPVVVTVCPHSVDLRFSPCLMCHNGQQGGGG